MISVIVCTYNREKYLGECLQHLANQTALPSTYEIVIINNNSPDRSELICKDFIENNRDLNITYHLEINQGHTHARNAGIEKSEGDLLAFIDDDAFVDENYVREISQAFASSDASAIGGKIDPVYESGKVPDWMSPFLLPLVSALDMGNSVKIFSGTKHPIGANMVFRRNVFEQLGNFNIELGRRGSTGLEGGDEKEMFLRMKNSHMRLEYHPKVLVKHIIGEQRTTKQYVKGLALGVGTSERKRLHGTALFGKWISEGVKFGGTIILAAAYFFTMRFAAAWMLIKFRFWVAKGLLS